MKKINIAALLICSTLLFSSPIFARDLSIDQAVSEAINKSSQILLATLDIQSAQIGENSKYSVFYPTVNLGLSLNRANTQKNPAIKTTLTGSINASFNFNPAMITSLQSTALELKSKSISLDKAKSDLELQVKKLYYGILVQEAAYDVLKQNIDNMNETLENTKEAYENGYIPELQVLQIQSQLSSQKASLEKSNYGISAQKRTLLFLIGSENITEDVNLTTKLPSTFNDDLSSYSIDKAIACSTDLESLNINKELLEINKKALVQRTYIPSLSISASYMPTVSDVTNIDAYAFDKLVDNGSLSAVVSFNVSNLIPGSSTYKALDQLDVSIEQLAMSRGNLQSSIVLDYNTKMEAIKDAKRQMQLSKESIALSQKSYDSTALSYENGDSTFSDLQSSQLNVSNAKLGLLQSQYTYLSALLDLDNQCSR